VSQESALAFVEKTLTDSSLRSGIAALGPDDVAGLVHIANSAGYTVSVEDLKGVFSGYEAGGGLSDAALDQVSGGLNPQPLPPKTVRSFFHINPSVLRGIIIVSGR
jgi:predicted ribosomally synthesized peptide with nif11-like leader